MCEENKAFDAGSKLGEDGLKLDCSRAPGAEASPAQTSLEGVGEKGGGGGGWANKHAWL